MDMCDADDVRCDEGVSDYQSNRSLGLQAK